MSKLQEKPSALKKEHPTLQTMKFLNFFSVFVGHFCPPGFGSGSGSETLVKRQNLNMGDGRKEKGRKEKGRESKLYHRENGIDVNRRVTIQRSIRLCGDHCRLYLPAPTLSTRDTLHHPRPDQLTSLLSFSA